MAAKRGQRIGALDDPTEGKKGNSSENGGTPGVGVPFTILPDGELPLLSERCRVRV